MGVSMWGVAHLSDIPYLFYNDHFGAGADNSRPQLTLARDFSRTIIQFVYGCLKGLIIGFRNGQLLSRNHFQNLEQATCPVIYQCSCLVVLVAQDSLHVTNSLDLKWKVYPMQRKRFAVKSYFSSCAFVNGQEFREEAGYDDRGPCCSASAVSAVRNTFISQQYSFVLLPNPYNQSEWLRAVSVNSEFFHGMRYPAKEITTIAT